jgi:hypothetical protein
VIDRRSGIRDTVNVVVWQERSAGSLVSQSITAANDALVGKEVNDFVTVVLQGISHASEV